MGWSIGFDETWNRDIGYGVVAYCDHPKCNKVIDRGLAYVCGGGPYGQAGHEGGRDGCGLYFCSDHLGYNSHCPKCRRYDKNPYKQKPEHPEWIKWKMTDASWAEWRAENQTLCKQYEAMLNEIV